MNKSSVIISAVIFLALALVASTITVGRGAAAPASDVVLLRCTQTASEEVGIAESGSSFGAPSFTADTSCAAALASLLKKGFRFQAVHGDDVFLYTMVKP